MIRDITIGQYYPVKSRIHSLDPRVKIICTLFISCLFVCSEFFPWVCNCDIVSRNGNLYVESPSEIYCKRVKTDRDPSDVYGRYESVFDKRRRNAAAFLDFYDYGRRRSYFGVYGASLNVSCGGIVSYDVYDISQRIDGRNGKTAESFEQASSSGS